MGHGTTRRLFRYFLCVFMALPLAVPAAQAPEATLRTTVNEVLLDLVVRDRHANIIHDLRPNEVQVFENGVLQDVRHFEFVDGRTATAGPVAGAASSSSDETTAKASDMQRTVNELRDISVVSVVIANLDPRGRKLTVDAMHKFVQTELKPNTYVGVFSLSMAGLRYLQPYTNDGEKISTAVEQATSNVLSGQLQAVNQLSMQNNGLGSTDQPSTASSDGGGAGAPTLGATSGPGLAIASLMSTQWVDELHDVYAESQRYLTPLHTLAQAQKDIPGRKVVLLFSAGLPVHEDTSELFQAVVSTANRANVTIYAVDTRGLNSRSTLENSRRMLQAASQASMQQQMAKVSGGHMEVTPNEARASDLAVQSIHSDTRHNLSDLAEGTGGELLPDTLDLLEPLERALENVRTHYELTYSPANAMTDGTFRKIEVKVSRPGAKVFARSGYFALPVLNGRQIYPFEMATMKALNTTPVLRQFEFHATALQFRPGPARTQMAFVFQAPTHDLAIEKDGEWAKVHVCVTGLVKDEHGLVVQKISKDIPYEVPANRTAELERGIVSFTAPFQVPTGHYTLETAAVDRKSMKASVSRTALFVTDDRGLAMSDVAVARRVDAVQGLPDFTDPLEARGGKVTPELSRVALADSGGKVLFYAVAYPPAPIDAPVDASIEIWRDGQLLIKSPASQVPLDSMGTASILASLPSAKLPPGDYEARITFEFKGQRVMKAVPFTTNAGT